jgi:hypothetical protein
MSPMNENDARDLLPWYAAGALEPEERAAVEAALEQSENLRDELAQMQVLQEAVTDTAGEPQWNPALITDALARIDAYEAEKAAPGLAGKLGTWLRENFLTGWEGVPTLAKVAVGAQLALLLAIGGAWLGQPSSPTDSGAWGGTVGLDPHAVHIKLGFQQGVDEETLRETILGIDGQIVRGPSALGLYTVQIEGLAQEDEEAVAKLLADLLARKDVVGMATKGY